MMIRKITLNTAMVKLVAVFQKLSLNLSSRSLSKLIAPLRVVLITVIVFLSAVAVSHSAQAAIDVYEFDTPQQEERYRALIEEFRCPKCQNQNLAASDSMISQDLKRKTFNMIMDGKSDDEIRDYMYERYGDFISYKPPIRPSTWILWFLPPIALIVLIGWWLSRTAAKSKKQMAGNSSVADTDPLASDLSEGEQTALDNLLGKHGHRPDNGTSDDKS